MRTTSTLPEPIEAIFTGEDVLRFHDVVRRVPVADEVARYAVQTGRRQSSRAGRFQRLRQ